MQPQDPHKAEGKQKIVTEWWLCTSSYPVWSLEHPHPWYPCPANRMIWWKQRLRIQHQQEQEELSWSSKPISQERYCHLFHWRWCWNSNIWCLMSHYLNTDCCCCSKPMSHWCCHCQCYWYNFLQGRYSLEGMVELWAERKTHQGQTQSEEFAHMAVISCPMYLAEVHFHLK